MLNRVKKPLIGGLCIVTLSGCVTPISPVTEARLSSEINCNSAEADIAALEEDRPDDADRFLSGLATYTPPGFITGILTGQLDERASVVNGGHSKGIDAKITAIAAECLS